MSGVLALWTAALRQERWVMATPRHIASSWICLVLKESGVAAGASILLPEADRRSIPIVSHAGGAAASAPQHPCLRLAGLRLHLGLLPAPEGSCRASGLLHPAQCTATLVLGPPPSTCKMGGFVRHLCRSTTRPGLGCFHPLWGGHGCPCAPPFPTRGSSSPWMSSMRLTFGLEARREPRARLALGP